MRLQSSQANCGAAALYNAGCALGRRMSLEECERACRTMFDGTSERKLVAGAMRFGFEASVFKEASELLARLWLFDTLRAGKVIIACVDGFDHWVAVIGVAGNRVLVADGAENELVVSYSEGEFLQRWKHPSARRGYYALVVS